jgi:hypothetical protein
VLSDGPGYVELLEWIHLNDNPLRAEAAVSELDLEIVDHWTVRRDSPHIALLMSAASKILRPLELTGGMLAAAQHRGQFVPLGLA